MLVKCPTASQLIGQERLQIVIFPRLRPFCVFEIVLWLFGFEGGLVGRLWLPLLGSSEISASVALLAHKGSILRYHHHCFLVLCGPGGSGNLRAINEVILSLWGPKLGFAAC